MPMTYRWIPRSLDEADVVPRLQRELNDLPKSLARALALRGITTLEEAKHFFRADRAALHDPFEMADMDFNAPKFGNQGEAPF